jgi:hypothetical protein
VPTGCQIIFFSENIGRLMVMSWRNDILLNEGIRAPSQVNKFFDACVQWMSESKHDAHGTPTICSEPAVIEATLPNVATCRSIGLADTDNVQHVPRPCAVCSNPTTDRSTGSPFTRAYIIYMCNRCRQQIDASSS